MHLYLSDFFQGLAAGQKLASYDQVGNSLPTRDVQSKWKFTKSDKHLHLSDGNHTHHFEAPEGFKSEEAFPLVKHDEPKEIEGEKSEGHAQVHRSDPGSIYFTMQDGKGNATYTFSHTGENNWKAIPKAKKKKEPVLTNVDHYEFAKGAEEILAKLAEPTFMDKTLGAVDYVGRSPGVSPLLSAVIGGLGGTAYHFGKRHFYNTDEENQAEDAEGIMPVLKRVGIPAAALGGLGLIQSTVTPQHYINRSLGDSKSHSLFGPK